MGNSEKGPERWGTVRPDALVTKLNLCGGKQNLESDQALDTNIWSKTFGLRSRKRKWDCLGGKEGELLKSITGQKNKCVMSAVILVDGKYVKWSRQEKPLKKETPPPFSPAAEGLRGFCSQKSIKVHKLLFGNSFFFFFIYINMFSLLSRECKKCLMQWGGLCTQVPVGRLLSALCYSCQINSVKEGFTSKIYRVLWRRDRAFTFHLGNRRKKKEKVSPLVLICFHRCWIYIYIYIF